MPSLTFTTAYVMFITAKIASFKTIVTIRKICESEVVIGGNCKYDPTNSLCSSLKHAELLMGNLASEQLHVSTSSDAKHDILQA